MEYQRIDESALYPLYPQRYLVTTLYALTQMMTSVLMNTLNPIASELANIYNQSPIVVNLGGLLFILMHPIFTFPAAYVIDNKGVKAGIILGSVLCILGVSIRLLINQGFWVVIVGQLLSGIGRPFILNCQAKVSCNWFHASKRGGVTQLLTLINNVSLIIGILIPGIVFRGYTSQGDNPQPIQQGKDLAFKLMLIEAIMGYLCFIPNIFFQIEKPPTPPSESGDMKREPFGEAVKSIIKKKNYLLLLGAFGLYFGLFNAISITLSYMLEPWFGNNSMAVAAVGGSPVLSGIIGVMIIGPIQRKSQKFKKWIIICMLGSSSAMILFYPILETYSLTATCFISAYNSFWLIPLVPIMLQLGCELAFPVGEGAAVGLLFAFGNLGGFFLGLIMSSIVDGETKQGTLGGVMFCFGLFLVGLAMIFFMKEELNRRNAQKILQEKRRTSTGSSASSRRNSETILESVPEKYSEINANPDLL